jgi:hypothetical protein
MQFLDWLRPAKSLRTNSASRSLMARHDLERLMNAMFVARLKVGPDHNIPESDWRLHKHNAGRSGPAE